MSYRFPHTIENNLGERLTFKEIVHEPDGDRLLMENHVAPGCGPIMHTHYLQDESLTVVYGKLAYQVLGEETKYAGEGESVTFKRGVPHRFWNAGDSELHCTGWVKPANTIVFFLDKIYAAQVKSGNEQPEKFDGAYLLTKYAREYDLPEIPRFVKKVVLPLTYRFGRLMGKYRHFKNAPRPVTS